jgi:hypothetical protein
MRFIPILLTFIMSLAFATDVPYVFTAGTVASAANVNANFSSLSTRITTLENTAQTQNPASIYTPTIGLPAYTFGGYTIQNSSYVNIPVGGVNYMLVSVPAGANSTVVTFPVLSGGSAKFTVSPGTAGTATEAFRINNRPVYCPKGIQASRQTSVGYATYSSTISVSTTFSADLIISLGGNEFMALTVAYTTTTTNFSGSGGSFSSPSNVSALASKASTETVNQYKQYVNTLIGLISVQ